MLECPEETTCRTHEDCPESMVCSFEDGACGVLSDGICRVPDEICPGGGVGLITCQGYPALNGCEVLASGGSVFAFGGTGNPDSELFGCGDTTCEMATELCVIRITDTSADAYFYDSFSASCQPLQPECAQGDCSCLDLPQGPGAPACLDSPGQTYLFYVED